MSNELSELIEDLKEQLIFLTELGVENLNADLPEISADLRPELPSPQNKNEIPRQRLEKFIPTDEILKKAVETKGPTESPKLKSRSGILESAKISNLSDRTKHDFTRKILQKDELQQTKLSENMPEKPKLKESLFGDITEALPDSTETLADIRQEIGKECERCGLCEERTQVVNSIGGPQADLMIIGEAPGADEDARGEPFVGRAGKLLTKIIEAIGMKREDVFIGNINRCRPPGNRQPTAEESVACKPFLLREIAVVRPKVIVVLGNTACQNLLETKVGITKLRGNFQNYHGVKVMPTFHPAYLLRDPRKKREVWEDMKTVRAEIEKAD